MASRTCARSRPRGPPAPSSRRTCPPTAPSGCACSVEGRLRAPARPALPRCGCARRTATPRSAPTRSPATTTTRWSSSWSSGCPTARSRRSSPTSPRSATCSRCAARSGGGSPGTPATPALCLVGGTGVVPAVSMLRTARRLDRRDLLRVVAVARGPDDLPYGDELARAGATLAYTRVDTDVRPAGAPTRRRGHAPARRRGARLRLRLGPVRVVRRDPAARLRRAGRPTSGSSGSVRPADPSGGPPARGLEPWNLDGLTPAAVTRRGLCVPCGAACNRAAARPSAAASPHPCGCAGHRRPVAASKARCGGTVAHAGPTRDRMSWTTRAEGARLEHRVHLSRPRDRCLAQPAGWPGALPDDLPRRWSRPSPAACPSPTSSGPGTSWWRLPSRR